MIRFETDQTIETDNSLVRIETDLFLQQAPVPVNVTRLSLQMVSFVNPSVLHILTAHPRRIQSHINTDGLKIDQLLKMCKTENAY